MSVASSVVPTPAGSRAPSVLGGEPSQGGPISKEDEKALVKELRKTQLPSGWKVYVSRSTGKPYWHHKESNITQWSSPAAPSPTPTPAPPARLPHQTAHSDGEGASEAAPAAQGGPAAGMSIEGGAPAGALTPAGTAPPLGAPERMSSPNSDGLKRVAGNGTSTRASAPGHEEDTASPGGGIKQARVQQQAPRSFQGLHIRVCDLWTSGLLV